MGVYIDAMVTPVPKKKLAAYSRISRTFGKVWREHGAIAFRECVADDVSWGKRTSFPRSVKLKPGEVVCLAVTVYQSRRHRDQVNARAMKDPRIARFMKPNAFPADGRRMFFGGFKATVDL
jgi:uncharacterized protein YbaA (DUF1428 family)